jgi:hypothetical protein
VIQLLATYQHVNSRNALTDLTDHSDQIATLLRAAIGFAFRPHPDILFGQWRNCVLGADCAVSTIATMGSRPA